MFIVDHCSRCSYGCFAICFANRIGVARCCATSPFLECWLPRKVDLPNLRAERWMDVLFLFFQCSSCRHDEGDDVV